MPLVCTTNSFVSRVSDCGNHAGIVEIKYASDGQVDFDALNIGAYPNFNTNSYTFSDFPSLLYGQWETLIFDNTESVLTSIKPNAAPYFDIEINNIRFKNLVNTRHLQEVTRLGNVTCIVLLNNGQKLLVGVHFDTLLNKFVSSQKTGRPLRFAQMTATSETQGNEVGINTVFNLSGRQCVQFHEFSGDWALIDFYTYARINPLLATLPSRDTIFDAETDLGVGRWFVYSGVGTSGLNGLVGRTSDDAFGTTAISLILNTLPAYDTIEDATAALGSGRWFVYTMATMSGFAGIVSKTLGGVQYGTLTETDKYLNTMPRFSTMDDATAGLGVGNFFVYASDSLTGFANLLSITQ